MDIDEQKEKLYRTNKGFKKEVDVTKFDEMIELLEISNEAFSKFCDISRKSLFSKSRVRKVGEIGECISALKTELSDIKKNL